MNYLSSSEKKLLVSIFFFILLGSGIKYFSGSGRFNLNANTFAAQKNKLSPVNINTASENELITIPGIGPVTAGRIIEYRRENNGFKSADELLKIKGIGIKKLERIQPLIIIE